MQRALRFVVVLFGAICVLIALAHIAIGSAIIPGSGTFSTSIDSEDQFYASLFLGFGAALIWCSRDLHARARLFDALLVIFLIGGLARVISVLQLGLPHPLFAFLGAIELVLPPLLWWWRKRAFA